MNDVDEGSTMTASEIGPRREGFERFYVNETGKVFSI